MQLNLTTDYALRILLYLAINTDKKLTSTKIADQMKIPEGYLMKVIGKLKKYEYIESFQGLNGGYKLKRAPTEITLQDIVQNLEGVARISRSWDKCKSTDVSEDSVFYMIRRCFAHLQILLDEKLSSITVQSIIDGQIDALDALNVMSDIKGGAYEK